ncbi:hypothetical protein D9619_004162 [Psilocybe cf. subviscida]|uniref:Arrestin-like N-terminal domain-containing protein n=1 Tax=Psilocybe cf. subviscida TaxID=2480587 RepID=A0A8H5BQ01_9AGAR|nr:hypothetical protein D9619_004162 [Psilocybe cf. subviscida]
MSSDTKSPSGPPTDALPSYADAGGRPQQTAGSSSAGGMTEHHRFLETSKGRKWLGLSVKSRSPTAASMPAFVEGDTISGSVSIDLDKAESSKGITISIQGSTTFVGQDEEVFFQEEVSLWTPSGNDGKLSGKQSWAFSFKLPAEVKVSEPQRGPLNTFRMPPNFTERASPAYIDYKLTATVKRGFLKVNQTLMTNIIYQPTTIPDPPSAVRRMAYWEGSPLVGPEGDPEGWKVLPPVKIQGALSDKAVDIDCTLAVAIPLSYATGSPIPFMATFTGQDASVLETVAVAKAIQLRLRRSMATGDEATDDNGVRRTDNHFSQDMGIGYFWPSQEGAAQPLKRVFQGELEVVKGLKPSFIFPKVSLRYTLVMLPFDIQGFVPSSPPSPVLLSEPLKICSRQVPDLKIHSYAPPGYDKPNLIDYNKSVGLLENGNQRFLPHHTAR